MSRDEEWIDGEEAGLRLLLFAPLIAAPDAALGRALAAAPMAAVIVPPVAVAAWLPVCRDAGCALLAADDVEAALTVGADGVHVHRAEAASSARQRLGDRRLVGVSVGLSRHFAMVAGELGADYVMFGSEGGAATLDPLVELVGWWSELFVLPCAALVPAHEAVVPLAAAGLDFVAVELAPLDAADRVADLTRLIGKARTPR